MIAGRDVRPGPALAQAQARVPDLHIEPADPAADAAALIEELGYAPYFLTVNSILRFARSRDILCQDATPPLIQPCVSY